MNERMQDIRRVHKQIRSVLHTKPTLGQRIKAWWFEWRLRRGWY